MTLSAVIQVNFKDVGHIQVVRRGNRSLSIPEEPDDVYLYEAVLEHGGRVKTAAGIEHRYGDGAVVLLRKALEAVT